MQNTEKVNHNEFLERKAKLRMCSLKKLKKYNLNFCHEFNGKHLLNSAGNEDLKFLERLLQAGIDVNYKNDKGFNAAYYIKNSHDPYHHLKLLIKYGIDINSNQHNLLTYISEKYGYLDDDSHEELTKIQLLLLSKNIDLINPKKETNEQINILAALTPEVLKYLLHYKNIPIFDIKDSLGHNVLHPIMSSFVYNGYSFFNLEKILKMMKPEQINNINQFGENVLWNVSSDKSNKIGLLQKYGLNIHLKDNEGRSILECSCTTFNYPLAKTLIAYGVNLSEQCAMNTCNQSKEKIKKDNGWDEEYYELMLLQAKKQKSDYEKKEINNLFTNNDNEIYPTLSRKRI